MEENDPGPYLSMEGKRTDSKALSTYVRFATKKAELAAVRVLHEHISPPFVTQTFSLVLFNFGAKYKNKSSTNVSITYIRVFYILR